MRGRRLRLPVDADANARFETGGQKKPATKSPSLPVS
jgi:hypothetical protein